MKMTSHSRRPYSVVKVEPSPWMPTAGRAARGSEGREARAQQPASQAVTCERSRRFTPFLPRVLRHVGHRSLLEGEVPERPKPQCEGAEGLACLRGSSAFHPCREGRQPRGRPVPTSQPGPRGCWPPGPPDRLAGIRPAGPRALSGHTAARMTGQAGTRELSGRSPSGVAVPLCPAWLGLCSAPFSQAPAPRPCSLLP